MKDTDRTDAINRVSTNGPGSGPTNGSTKAPKEKPILFSTPMVQAIIEERKTQTRRIVKPQPDQNPQFNHALDWEDFTYNKENIGKYCPYGQPGDLLWVRETFYTHNKYDGIIYNADIGNTEIFKGPEWKKKPSIYMPKATARIWLKIKGIRIERVRDISDEAAIAEGVEITYDKDKPNEPLFYFYPCGDLRDDTYIINGQIVSFYSLWRSINGQKSWDDNPWVWVVEFERTEIPNRSPSL